MVASFEERQILLDIVVFDMQFNLSLAQLFSPELCYHRIYGGRPHIAISSKISKVSACVTCVHTHVPCMYVCVCMHVRARVCVCVCVCVYARVGESVHIHVSMHTHKQTYCLCVCLCVYKKDLVSESTRLVS